MIIEEFLSIFMTIPTAFFSVFYCIFFAYFLIAAVIGLDQNLGLDLGDALEIPTDMEFNIYVSSGLSRVPLSVGLSLVSLFGTIITFFIQSEILSLFINYDNDFDPFTVIYIIISVAIFIPAFLASLYISGFLAKYIKPIFDNDGGRVIFSYDGREAIVNSLSITESSGDVKCRDDEGQTHILNVYAVGGNNLKKGDRVIIIEKNNENNRYRVVERLEVSE